MATSPEQAHVRRIEPLAEAWRSAAWPGGLFDTARRPATERVEGVIRTPHHMVILTVRGGAERLQVRTDCGHRFDGPERSGAVSFVPADCERRLRMSRVRSEWASLSVRPEVFDGPGAGVSMAPFTNAEDPFLAGAVGGMWRLMGMDGGLEPLHGEAMGLAMAHYLARRFGRPQAGMPRSRHGLAPWQLRRVEAYIDDNLAEEIRIADLARLVGLSEGHFHRAFRTSTGRTPLDRVNAARITRAMSILATEDVPVAELAARVGFVSPSYFSRLFRRRTGCSPGALRRR